MTPREAPTDEERAEWRAQETPEADPLCHICGGRMSIESAGPDGFTWRCRKKGGGWGGFAHYQDSTQHRHATDSRVLRLLDALEAAERRALGGEDES